MRQEYNYPEKYRPKTIQDCVLPKELKTTFQNFVDDGNIPTLLLTGTAGLGKSTVAMALCEELNIDYMMINASKERGIDVIRGRISAFAPTISLDGGGGRKVIILDEADGMTPEAQAGMKGTIEQFSSNCHFIFTANNKNKIIEPIQSRCINISFNFPKSEKRSIMGQFMKRTQEILDGEGVKYDNAVLAQLIKTYYPDFRRTLNELQRYSIGGTIDSGILSNLTDVKIDEIVDLLKQKKFTVLRKYIGENSDIIDFDGVYTKIYRSMDDWLVDSSVPPAVVLTGEWSYRSYFSVDKEITLMAFLTELMASCDFKE